MHRAGKTPSGGHASHLPAQALWPALAPRNALFLCVVVLNGFRRLAPPY